MCQWSASIVLFGILESFKCNASLLILLSTGVSQSKGNVLPLLQLGKQKTREVNLRPLRRPEACLWTQPKSPGLQSPGIFNGQHFSTKQILGLSWTAQVQVCIVACPSPKQCLHFVKPGKITENRVASKPFRICNFHIYGICFSSAPESRIETMRDSFIYYY